MWSDTGFGGYRFVWLLKISDSGGSLNFIEGSKHTLFKIKRVFSLYDMPRSATRGGYGHRELEQLSVAL